MNGFTADKTHSIPEADRAAYAAAYARPGRMRAGWAYFVSFQQAAKDFAELSQTTLKMPVLAIGGEKANGTLLGLQMKIVASDATMIVPQNTGPLGARGTAQGNNGRADKIFVIARSAKQDFANLLSRRKRVGGTQSLFSFTNCCGRLDPVHHRHVDVHQNQVVTPVL